MGVTITLPRLGAPVDELWHVLLDLGGSLDVGWTLIGGQMVLLHALEHGQTPPRISQDGDVVADIRAERDALLRVVASLEQAGFDLESMSADGLAHRYCRPAQPRAVVIDVLAPEGVGERTSLVTSPPGRTVQVPGGSQALARSERITVLHEGRRGAVSRPSLLAAVVIKAAATSLHPPARHYRDLALLCALVDDPFDMAGQMTRKDRARVRLAHQLLAGTHPAWAPLPDLLRERGQVAYAVLHG